MNVLKTDTVYVQFKKKSDGELRNMRCTLIEDMIPEEDKPKNHDYAQVNMTEGLIKVYDLDASGWRAFYVDSVIEYRGSNQ